MTIGRGWNSIIKSLRDDIAKIDRNVHIVNISEGQTGGLIVHYSTKNLDGKQQANIDRRVARAEAVARQTCVECGGLGALAFTRQPLKGRVYCGNHKPQDWEFVPNE